MLHDMTLHAAASLPMSCEWLRAATVPFYRLLPGTIAVASHENLKWFSREYGRYVIQNAWREEATGSTSKIEQTPYL